MTYANVVTLEALPGKRDELVAILTRPNRELATSGCLLYEVGINDGRPDTVYVVELWESEDAREASLLLPNVQATIGDAMPLLTGDMNGQRFHLAGSPLHS